MRRTTLLREPGGISNNGVIDTPTGLVFLGQVQIGDTDVMPVMWSEP